MEFDRTIHKTFDGEAVDYGFLFGNSKIVFIKAGAGGGIPGQQDKYLKMAHRARERLGATVICASNHVKCIGLDKRVIEWCAGRMRLRGVELYFVGNSDGADQCITLAQNARAKKLLCINPSFVPGHDPTSRLIACDGVKKIFVYGTEDEEGAEMIPLLREREIPDFEIKTVNGADHSFTGMVDDFIKTIDLL